jgi:uncharacterized protein YndB with AHSA1/START domain
MPDIMHLLKIKAAPERVYTALTTPEGIRSWWTREAELDQRVGGAGVFSFYGGRFVTRVRVDELSPPVRVRWTTESTSSPGGWEGTSIAFDLRAEDGDTVLVFAHRGFAQANDGYARINTTWSYFLVSLQQYLETGEGTPAPDVDFARMTRRAA